MMLCALLVLTPQSDADWYVFEPKNDVGPSAIGMEDWLERPAGHRGHVTIKEDRFAFADGTPVKFWGVNLNHLAVAPEKSRAAYFAQRLAKYGVNSVRFHKFTTLGNDVIGDPTDSTKLDPTRLDRMDYFVNELRNRGIYHGWSHIFGHRLRPNDRNKVLAYDEIVKLERPSYLDDSTYGLVMFAPDLQDLHIQLTVNMLRHRNPYTSRTYAQEPSLAFIEMQNEDDIFFPSTQAAVDGSPTYRKLFCGQFSDWLRKKYGSEANLVKSWGPRGLDAFPNLQKGERLAARNIYPIANQYYFSPQSLRQNAHARQRLLDTARFLYETQAAFYRKFERAIRNTGYKGPLVGSSWQAGEGISHYYNLKSDSDIGVVDRHNYFGGRGWSVEPGPFQHESMLRRPGGDLLSTGLQQVKGRPFQLSEWADLVPTEWVAEAPAIIAAYGMGLQGWDGSYQFANSVDEFAREINDQGPWVIDSPTQLGQYPTLARMVYRGDVREGKPLPRRKVSMDQLMSGELGFSDAVRQEGDRKAFEGDVPPEALAVGKVEVEFTRRGERSVLPKYEPSSVRRSNTGQLSWRTLPRNGGYFTVDTPGTKAYVGFLSLGGGMEQHALGDHTVLYPPSATMPFASIFVTAADRSRDLGTTSRAIVTAVARQRNTGMRFSPDGTKLEVVGTPPLRLEPVVAHVVFPRKRFTVHLLDHDGRRTGRSRQVADGTLQIDGRTDMTPYYEIVFR